LPNRFREQVSSSTPFVPEEQGRDSFSTKFRFDEQSEPKEQERSLLAEEFRFFKLETS
jgi:hypothetical protein